jgi:serine/threonine-protein kinase
MGEVYRATDTRLKRAVALKVLPASLQADPDRLARFQREAEVLAALNHPNIAQVYGIETTSAGSGPAIVMELVEGPTLAERLAQGPMTADEVLSVARQILEALEAAHERGIVHRDLKPANIKFKEDGAVKVLDFGLARAVDPSGSGFGGGESATITSPALTALGMILGTAAYMAPEQAKGRAVDHRADMWAFGCVLYEMLTGSRAFAGEDVTDTLANVLKTEADMHALPPDVPPFMRQVIAACLRKDPRQRLASAQDARLALAGTFESPAANAGMAAGRTATSRQRLWTFAMGAVAAAVVLAGAAWVLQPVPTPAPVTRFDIIPPIDQAFRGISRPTMALSPDGQTVVFNVEGGLRARNMGELEPRLIGDTEGSLLNPFLSPDGKEVAFSTGLQLRRVVIAGGAQQVIAKDVPNPYGAHWTEDGTILVAGPNGISRVPATGGVLEVLIKSDGTDGFSLPQMLPGGDRVLFTSTPNGQYDRSQIVVHSIRTGARTVVMEGARDGRYVPTGHLVYAVEDGLFGVRFNLDTLTTDGPPAQLARGTWWRNTPHANWAVSSNGTLAYVPNLPADTRHFAWVRRDGVVTTIKNVIAGTTPRLSHDARRALLEIDGDLWIHDLDTGRRIRVTSDGRSGRPAWNPALPLVAFTSNRDGSSQVWMAPDDGVGPARRLTNLTGGLHVDSWSPDGKTLAFHRHPYDGALNEILAITPSDQAATPRPVVQVEFDSEGAVFSPDGRYIAYHSSETGLREVYIRPFPGPGPRVPVSVGGAREVVWGRNGEIYYRSTDGTQMIAVRVTTSPALVVGAPQVLFTGRFFLQPSGGSPRPQFDVTADGQRFLMIESERVAQPRIVIVQNWFEELRRLLPPR